MAPIISRLEPIKACTLKIDDIKKLYNKLAISVREAGESAVSTITQNEGTSDQDFARFKNEVLAAYIVTIVIRGSKGEVLVETSDSIFSSPNLPNKITNIYFDSVATHNVRYNVKPQQWFTLNLDFSAPRLLDWENTLSAPTPNASVVTIEGNSETWVSGVLHKVHETIFLNSTKRNFLHAAFIYDLGLWFLGIPFAFFLTAKMSAHIYSIFLNGNRFLIFAAHFYIFLLSIIFYRFFFGYTKWAFPKVELDDGKNAAKKHRRFWYATLIVPVIAIFKDYFKEYLKDLIDKVF